jgi:hypothetical protein
MGLGDLFETTIKRIRNVFQCQRCRHSISQFQRTILVPFWCLVNPLTLFPGCHYGPYAIGNALVDSEYEAAWLANQAAGRVVSQYGNRLSHEAMNNIKADFELQVAA